MANPIIYSLFLSKYFVAWEDDVSDVYFAKQVVEKQGYKDIRFNALYTQGFERTISSPSTVSLNYLGISLTDRVVMIAEVIGEGVIQVAGKDTDGTTAISSDLRGKGVDKFPARIIYSGKYLTGITLVPKEADVTFRIKLVVVCDATDSRYSL